MYPVTLSNFPCHGNGHKNYLGPCNRDVLHRPFCMESDKIPEGGTSTYILHLSVCTQSTSIRLFRVVDPNPDRAGSASFCRIRSDINSKCICFFFHESLILCKVYIHMKFKKEGQPKSRRLANETRIPKLARSDYRYPLTTGTELLYST
jgi:hypothetical protein